MGQDLNTVVDGVNLHKIWEDVHAIKHTFKNASVRVGVFNMSEWHYYIGPSGVMVKLEELLMNELHRMNLGRVGWTAV